jgi:hypothetical protein
VTQEAHKTQGKTGKLDITKIFKFLKGYYQVKRNLRMGENYTSDKESYTSDKDLCVIFTLL